MVAESLWHDSDAWCVQKGVAYDSEPGLLPPCRQRRWQSLTYVLLVYGGRFQPFRLLILAYFLEVHLSTLQLISIMIHGQLRHQARVRRKCTATFVLGSLIDIANFFHRFLLYWRKVNYIHSLFELSWWPLLPLPWSSSPQHILRCLMQWAFDYVKANAESIQRENAQLLHDSRILL